MLGIGRLPWYRGPNVIARSPGCQVTASTQNFGYRRRDRRSEVTVTNSRQEEPVTRASLREYAAVQRTRYLQATRTERGQRGAISAIYTTISLPIPARSCWRSAVRLMGCLAGTTIPTSDATAMMTAVRIARASS